MDAPPKYWPFDVVLAPGDQTEQHKQEIDFLNAAHCAGHKPYAFGAGDEYGAGSDAGRAGYIIVRGRKPREVLLIECRQTVLSAYVSEFRYAAKGLLQWLRGESVGNVLDDMRDHLVTMPGANSSYVLSKSEVGCKDVAAKK